MTLGRQPGGHRRRSADAAATAAVAVQLAHKLNNDALRFNLFLAEFGRDQNRSNLLALVC